MIVPLYIEYIEKHDFYRLWIVDSLGRLLYYPRPFYKDAKDFYSKLQRECIRELVDFQPESKDL